MNVLIIDDNAPMRSLVSDIITKHGNNAIEAAHGKQAINLLMVHKIDLIITDILMPELEGVELILRLRQSEIPIISMSAMSQKDVIARFYKSLGIVGFLQKPYMNSELMRLVNAVQEKQQSYALAES